MFREIPEYSRFSRFVATLQDHDQDLDNRDQDHNFQSLDQDQGYKEIR